MKFVLEGRIFVTKTEQGILGATVEIGDANNQFEEARQSLVTNRHGAFYFSFSGQLLEALRKASIELQLIVRDTNGDIITQQSPFSIPEKETLVRDVGLGEQELVNAVLPRVWNLDRLVPEEAFEVIDLAIDRFAPSEQISNYQSIASTFYCALPPVIQAPEILDFAEGTLLGSIEDRTQFSHRLQQLNFWNQRNLAIEAEPISAIQAEFLASEQFLGGLINALGPRSSQADFGMLPREQGIRLIAAAIQASGSNLPQMHRNLGIISAQFCALDNLHRLHQSALRAFRGNELDRRFFLNTLVHFGGGWGPDDSPGGGPPIPVPTPAPGGPTPVPGCFPWPPRQDDSGEFGIPEDAETWLCTAEAVRAYREYRDRATTYRILEVTPANACPGDEVVIRGENLQFEEGEVIICFSGLRRGTEVQVTPRATSNTEITVVVPTGAHCGPLQLKSSEPASILVCGVELPLFEGPSEPFIFEGGPTVISYFGTSAGDSFTCLQADELLFITWRTCNASRETLRIQEVGGSLLSEQTFREPDGDNTIAYRLPDVTRNFRVSIQLTVEGPCGNDQRELQFAVRRAARLDETQVVSFVIDTFRNWHRNISRTVRSYNPTHLSDLVNAVLTAELVESERLGTEGSGWSYTNCVIPERPLPLRIDVPPFPLMIRTDQLNEVLTDIIDPERGALRASIQSVLSDEALRELGTSAESVANRLLHVEAGMKVYALNCTLEERGLAMPTLGGSNGQSVVGAISTGTHGSNPQLGAIGDFVRAIHLVGPGGQEWWLEPASHPITDPAGMQRLIQEGRLDPCIKIEYNDDLFHSCLVAVGAAGVIYSVVLEAVSEYLLKTTTSGNTWGAMRTYIRDQIITPVVPTDWFVEITVNPTRAARLTVREPKPTDEPLTDPPEQDFTFEIALLSALFGPGIVAGGVTGVITLGSGAIGAVLGLIPSYFLRRAAEAGIDPFAWARIAEDVAVIHDLVTAVEDLVDIINDDFSEEALANAMPNLLNLLWRIGFYIIEGRELLDIAQNIYTNLGERPEGTFVGKSFQVMTGQPDCPTPPEDHSPLVRLIQSEEYAVPVESCIEFTDAILRLADGIRGDSPLPFPLPGFDSGLPFILILNLRFTRPTRAMIGMQQFEKTCCVEVYTVRDMDGNEAFFTGLEPILRAFNAVPHWGQFHPADMDFHSVFRRDGRDKLAVWQTQLDRIALESGGTPNTFRRDFVLERGLLSEL